LHALNPVRVRYIAEAVTGAGGGKSEKGQGQGKGVLSGYRILDVGCGGGLLSEALARCVWMCV
jgi:2-polyprenyl-6-hydroxyphenyl methylase/3-demethylubiquinone-9 3-methyltransferase